MSDILFIHRTSLRWRNAPSEYAPHETLYTRRTRRNDKEVLAPMMAGLAAEYGETKNVMIDATALKVQRTATNLGVKTGRVAA